MSQPIAISWRKTAAAVQKARFKTKNGVIGTMKIRIKARTMRWRHSDVFGCTATGKGGLPSLPRIQDQIPASRTAFEYEHFADGLEAVPFGEAALIKAS